MIHNTPKPSNGQDNSIPRADITLHIPGGKNHSISLEVLFTHLRQALKATTVNGGDHRIAVDHEGSVRLDGRLAYTPKSITAKDGVA